MTEVDTAVKEVVIAGKRVRQLATFGPGKSLGFCSGTFDEWCIYVEHPSYPRYPTDEWYFSLAKCWTEQHGPQKVYEHFVWVYERTTKTFDLEVSRGIDALAQQYSDPLEFTIIMHILYLGMIAEENKAHTRIGKGIKRLGMHELLIYDEEPKVAAHSTRGVEWRVIADRCREAKFEPPIRWD
jgi:hypothetical protein